MNCEECRFDWTNYLPLNGDYEKKEERGECSIYEIKPDVCYVPESQSIHGVYHKLAIEKRKPKNVMKIGA